METQTTLFKNNANDTTRNMTCIVAYTENNPDLYEDWMGCDE